MVSRPYPKKTTKNGLVEWLKVKALSSSPSTAKKKKRKKKLRKCLLVFISAEFTARNAKIQYCLHNKS
jgi:hypothetical protein